MTLRSSGWDMGGRWGLEVSWGEVWSWMACGYDKEGSATLVVKGG